MDLPLNPGLYNALVRVFKRVKIVNPGQAFIGRVSKHLVTDEPRMEIAHTGEYYFTCCPFCNDTGFRLYFNHMWGQRDERGRQMTFLAICYNESCLAKAENRDSLYEMLSESPRYLEELKIRPGKLVPERAREALPPGACQRLDTLPPSHKACAYVASRGFDPAKMGKLYGVSYCLESHYTFARDRLIIPLVEYGKLKGWQARHIGELPWKDKQRSKDLPPKYFSSPGIQKSKYIYNWDYMSQYETGVLVEGPTDVWSFGLMAGAIFGNNVSYNQTKKFQSVFRRRTGVLLLDPEEFEAESTQRKRRELELSMPGTFACVKLPDSTDPGSLDRAFLRDYVAQEALAQGVRVSWQKHS